MAYGIPNEAQIEGPSLDGLRLVTDREQTHSLIGSLIGREAVEVQGPRIDTYENLYALEQSHYAAEFIRDWYLQPNLTPVQRALAPLYSRRHSVNAITNQFAAKIVPCLMEKELETALDRFREVVPNTIDEEMVILTNDHQFGELHTGLHEFLPTTEEQTRLDVEQRLQDFVNADRNQFNDSHDRSIGTMLRTGMILTLDQETLETIHEAQEIARDGVIPLTEHLKNERILTLSGLENSKISLAIHDFMDHIWTFDMIRRSGILDRYQGMFDSIGNPESTDIFKREGEIVASVAFGVRYFQNMHAGFGPRMRASQIEEHLDGLLVAGDLETRHMEAYRTIKGLRKGSVEWQSLGFTFSNYLTELDEQRRKHGAIKQRDPRSRQILGELDPLSPDYLCFFIDTHHQLLSSKNKHRDDLFRMHILLEEYLSSAAKNNIPQDQPLTIKLDELRGLDFTQTTLPAQRILWMRNNYGFTATRDAIV